MKPGRPTKYTPELAKEICEKIATRGAALKTICKENPHFPHLDTIYEWMKKYPSFSEDYVKAKKQQITALVEEILEISDDSSNDTKQCKNGEIACNSEWIARSRLRVDTRKWIAAKLVPKLYGDNMIARELADEIEELKLSLNVKNIRNSKDGKQTMDPGCDKT